MLIGIFKSNQRTINLFVIIITTILWAPSFFNINEANHAYNTLLSNLPFLKIKWLNNVISLLIVCGEAIYLNYIINEFKLAKRNTHLAALMFVILNGAYSPITTVSPVLLTNAILLMVVHQLFLINNLKQAYALAFNTSFLVGIAALIYFPAIILFPLVWITLSYTKTIVWRELVISLIGLSVPFIYQISYYFVSDQLALLTYNDFNPTYFVESFKDWSSYNCFYFIVLGAILIPSSLFYMIAINNSIVKIKKHMVLILLLLFASTLTIFFNQYDYLSTYLTISIPLSVMLANFFNDIKRKWLSELLFLILIGSMITSYFS